MARLNVHKPTRIEVREAAIRAASLGGRSGFIRTPTLNDDSVRSLALQADVVSFDIFDTAVVRSLSAPDMLFNFLGDPSASFRTSRIEAEDAARRAASERGVDEVSLEEIHQLAEWPTLSHGGALDDLLLQELRLERMFCMAHPPALQLFEELKEQERPLAFISDTYLSRDTVIELLTSCGFAGWSEVIVSSGHGRTKRSGELFDIAAERFERPASWLHLGDTLVPDVVNARRRGIKACYVPRPIDQLRLSAPGLESAIARAVSPMLASVLLGSLANRFAATPGPSRDHASLVDAVATALAPTAASDAQPRDEALYGPAALEIVADLHRLIEPNSDDLDRVGSALDEYRRASTAR